MAIESDILKDIGEYKPKFMFGLTLRQFTCTTLGGVVAIASYVGLHTIFITEFCLIVSGILGACITIFGYAHPYGLPLEKFLYILYRQIFLCPAGRPYKTKNLYEKTQNAIEVAERKEEAKKKNLKKLEKENQAKRSALAKENINYRPIK